MKLINLNGLSLSLSWLTAMLLATLLTDGVFAQEKPAAAQGWGTLTGKILLDGPAPPATAEQVGNHKDRPVCLVDGQVPADDRLVVDDHGGLRDMFVMLVRPKRNKKGGVELPIHPTYQNTVTQTLQLDNRKCRFVPHAMFVQVDQPLVLKNSDDVGHNCKITSFNNEHNVNLPAGGEAEIKLTAADRIPATVSCEIHPWMDAVLLAKDHPYVAITAADGSFTMENVPVGDWQFQFWHQSTGYLRTLKVPDMKVDRKGRVTVSIESQLRTDLGEMRLPVSAIKL